MKKLFLLVVCAVLSIGARAQFSGSGNGTEADPYRIYTDIHLAQMANFLNQDSVFFELMKDVDLTSYIMENSPSQGWTPVGVESAPFKGVLKGNGHTISGLLVNRTNTNNIGLFGYISDATISQLNVKGSNVKGQAFVGALAGTAARSTVQEISITLTGNVKGTDNVGGVIGKSVSSNISDISFSATQTEGSNYVGGAIGHMTYSSLSKCTLSVDVSASSNVGGIVGYMSDGSATDCKASAKVTGTGDAVGGVAGCVKASDVMSAFVVGNVSGAVSVGGAFGLIEGTTNIDKVSSTGAINGKANVSGIAGELATSSIVTFKSASSKGAITNAGDYTGGIVGKSDGVCINSMDDCSHFGDIKGVNYVGGLVGAVLKIDAVAPTLNSYQLRGDYTSNSTIFATFSDKIITGSTVSRNLNNCTAIGNIEGQNYVGGLVGESLYATAYTSTTLTYTYTIENSIGTGVYLWKNGVYQSHKKTYDRYSKEYRCCYDYPYITYTKGISAISLVNNYYSGEINAQNYVGGLVGHIVGGDIKNCFTYSTIEGQEKVGGLAGNVEGFSATQYATIKSSIANNTSVAASSANVGRIFGTKGDYVTIGALGSAEGNRALTQTCVLLCGVAQEVVDNEQNGTSVGPSMLKLKGNYVSWGWDFNDDWNILETESFPYKKYQAAPPVIKSTLESHDTSISGQSLNGGTVYMYYRDRDAVSTTCNGNDWVFETDALQSGAQVQLYADVEGMTPSYFTSATVKYPGSGTEDDPWRIYTAEDLQGAINSGYFKVMNNISLTSWINENSPIKGWPAIGRNSSVPTFINGDGHKISGFWMDTDENYNGLFSNYSAGYIKNLNVEVAEGKKVKGGNYTGILIGRMANGQIINCSVKGDVEAGNYAGGLAGYTFNSELTSSHFAGTLTGDGEYVGGLTAQSDNSSISLCSASGTINSTSTGDMKVGGLVGATLNGGTVSKSFANTTVTANGTGECGGLVGHNDAIMTESYSKGTVTSSGDYTGGLIGLGGNVSNCYSTADVNGGLYTAGLIGYTYGAIDKCYASGNVNGVRYGAGLVGELDGPSAKVTNSVAANNIVNLTDQSAWGCRVIGGYKNDAAEPTMRSNFALSTMQVSLNNVPQKKTDDNIEGVARTAEELMAESTYEGLGWEMTNVWAIEEGIGYPTLRQSAESPSFPDGDDTGDGGEDIDSPSDNILETDISKIPNVVYTSRLTVKMGNDFVLPINMKSEKEEIVGFQCDIYLPSCVRLEKNSRGNVKAPTFNAETNRTSLDYHTISAATQPDGSVRVLCYSTENELIIGIDGTVCDFNATLAEDTKPGEYAIKMKNITMTTATSVKYKVSEATFALCVPSYVKGDANGDLEIDVADISTTANYILGNEAENFVKEAADMDDDDVIDVADIAGIANVILYGNGISAMKVRNKVNTTRATSSPSLEVASFSVESGAKMASPTLNLFNPGDVFCGFQCDMYFPEGIGWAKNSRGKLSAPTFNAEADRTSSEYHTVGAAQQEDGAVRILCYSNENEVFLGEEGAILNLPITFAGNLADGIYEVVIKNIVLSRPTMPKLTLGEYRFAITVGNGVATDFALLDCTEFKGGEEKTCKKLTYTRNFTDTEWQPLYVPVALQYEDWAGKMEVAAINNFHQYDMDGDGKLDYTELEVDLITDGTLMPSTPYVVRAKDALGECTIEVTSPVLYPSMLNTISCSSTSMMYSFSGVYSTTEVSNAYAVQNGELALCSSATIQPQRWYMTVTPRGTTKANIPARIRIRTTEDYVDGVDAAHAEESITATYNLMGQRVNSNAKGIVFRNGRKISVR